MSPNNCEVPFNFIFIVCSSFNRLYGFQINMCPFFIVVYICIFEITRPRFLLCRKYAQKRVHRATRFMTACAPPAARMVRQLPLEAYRVCKVYRLCF